MRTSGNKLGRLLICSKLSKDTVGNAGTVGAAGLVGIADRAFGPSSNVYAVNFTALLLL